MLCWRVAPFDRCRGTDCRAWAHRPLRSALAAQGSCITGCGWRPLRKLPTLLRDCGPIARDGRLDDTLHVLLKEVALDRELKGRGTHLGDVVGLIPVPLRE